MTDQEFKKNVIGADVTFKSGTFIDCILRISRKIDDLGNVYNSNFSVLTVLRQHEEGIITETSKGRKIRKEKEADNAQTKLFDDY